MAYDLQNKTILPFQVLQTRKRKDVESADVVVSVCIYAFDLLFFNGESLTTMPLAKRREILFENFTPQEGLSNLTKVNSNLQQASILPQLQISKPFLMNPFLSLVKGLWLKPCKKIRLTSQVRGAEIG